MLKHRNPLFKTEPMSAAYRMKLHRARKKGREVPRGKPGRKPKQIEPTITAHPGIDRGYPLDFISPIRHVATELEKAGKRGATLKEMTATYRHPNTGDVSRIEAIHGCVTEGDANRFLVDRAISALNEQVEWARAADRYRLAVPFEELRYEGRPLVRCREDDGSVSAVEAMLTGKEQTS